MTPADLDAYAEVMMRRGISSASFDGVSIVMGPRLVSADPDDTKKEKPRANGIDEALKL
jgi:hypothetical protein